MKKASKKNIHKKAKKEGTSRIRPLGDRVLVREIVTEEKETRTASGIIIPVNETGDKGSKKGEVIAVGPGRREDGTVIAVSVSVGDKVLFQWGDKIVLGDAAVSAAGSSDDDYYLVRESEILAIIK